MPYFSRLSKSFLIFKSRLLATTTNYNRQNALTLKIALLFLTFAFPYLCIFMFLELRFTTYLVAITMGMFITTIILNKLNCNISSKLILIISPALTFFFAANTLTHAAGAQFLLFTLVPLPLLLFELSQLFWIVITILIPILLYTALEIGQYSLIVYKEIIPPHMIHAVRVSTILTTFLLLCLSAIYHFISNRRFELQIEEKNSVLSKQNALIHSESKKLKTANETIQKTNDLLQREYQKAALTQQQFLPNEMPTIEGYKVEHFFKGAYGVSGDFYDFKQFGFLTKFVVADVMSKSLSAAFITAHLYSIFRTLIQVDTSPATVLTIINQAFVDGRHDYEKAAAFAFDLDSKTNTITYSNACIGVAYLISCHTITELDYCGFMTGGERTEVYEEKKIQMQEGDILLIASDGLEDIVLKDGSRFGNEKLLELIAFYQKENPFNLSIQKYIMNHIQTIADFNLILADDIVLLAIERLTKQQ